MTYPVRKFSSEIQKQKMHLSQYCCLIFYSILSMGAAAKDGIEGTQPPEVSPKNLVCMPDNEDPVCESSGFVNTNVFWIEQKNGKEFARFTEFPRRSKPANILTYGFDTRPLYFKIEKDEVNDYYRAYYAAANVSIERAVWVRIKGKYFIESKSAPKKERASGAPVSCEGPLSIKWNVCVGVHTFSWGHRYEGEWLEGKMHGAGRLYSANGELLQAGVWINGIFQTTSNQAVQRRQDIPFSIDFNKCLKPGYPPGAVRAGTQGDTEVEYRVSKDGKIISAKVIKPSGDTETHKILDLLAADAVKACTGSPEIKEGVPVEAIGKVLYSWRLPEQVSTVGTSASLPKTSTETVFKPGGLDFKKCEKPEYTTAATRAGVGGTVVVGYVLGIDGRVEEASIEESSGEKREHKQLDRATLAAVKACIGTPTVIDGTPLKTFGRVRYEWR